MRTQTAVSGALSVEATREIACIATRATIDALRRNPLIQPEFLSLQDAARYLGYSEQQLSLFVKTSIAPRSVKFSNNARRFKRSDLDAWALAGGPSAFERAE
jgi:hypothetical protein